MRMRGRPTTARLWIRLSKCVAVVSLCKSWAACPWLEVQCRHSLGDLYAPYTVADSKRAQPTR